MTDEEVFCKKVLESLPRSSYQRPEMMQDILKLLDIIKGYRGLLRERLSSPDGEFEVTQNAVLMFQDNYNREVSRHAKTKEQVEILIKEREKLLDFIRNKAPMPGREKPQNSAPLPQNSNPD